MCWDFNMNEPMRDAWSTLWQFGNYADETLDAKLREIKPDAKYWQDANARCTNDNCRLKVAQEHKRCIEIHEEMEK